MERKGFVLLTGEIGTGKTTIVQTLLKNLDSSAQYVYLSNPTLSADDFLFYIAFGLGLKTQFKSKGAFLVEFKDFLQKFLQNQQNVLLIVDEAQKLSFKLLEEIRLLSNLETADEKLINIFLVGQPELNWKLRDAKCRPLLQRISIRYHINTLTEIETGDYIKTRLKVAGARDPEIFSKGVIKVIHKYAQGYPRIINILCDNALLLGYSNGKKDITPAMIKECYDDLQLPVTFVQKDTGSDIKKGREVYEPAKKRSYLRAAVLALLFIIVLSAGSVTSPGRQYLKTAGLFYMAYFNPDFSTIEKRTSDQSQRRVLPIPNVEESKAGKADKIETVKIGINKSLSIPGSDMPEERSTPAMQEEQLNILKPEERVITVKSGDTLLGLSMEMYGYADETTLEWIQRRNPEIRDVNLNEVGQKIVFSKPPFLNKKYRSIYSLHIASFRPLELAQSLFDRLIKKGYEAYILPFAHPQKGKMFRVAVGAFEDEASARNYGKKLIDMGVVDYAEPIRVDIM